MLALLGALAVPAAVAAGDAARPAVTHTIVIQAVSYQPAMLEVRHGDTVVWVNKDPIPHTVTAAGAFDSASIPAGGSWRYEATRAGVYPYTCTFHPNMKATLTVR